VTEAELDAILTESEDDNLLFDQIDCVLQAIKSVRLIGPNVLYRDCKIICRPMV